MRFLPHLLWLAQSAVLLLPSPAARAQAPPSGLGTAKVDGLLSPGEWDGAATADASLRNAHGEVTAAATFFLMNDVDNLYLALKVAVTVAPTSSWIVQFDADGDGSVEVGDDWFGVEAGVYVDRVLRNTRPGGSSPSTILKSAANGTAPACSGRRPGRLSSSSSIRSPRATPLTSA